MNNFVVAIIGEDDKPVGFYTAATQSTLEMSLDLQSAMVFDNKPLARTAMAAYQAQFPDLEVAVLPVTVSISLV